MKKLTTNEFIKKSEYIHNNEYDYSKVIYCGARIKITIVCLVHGEFLQTPNSHLSGQGCPKCAIKKRGIDKILNAKKLFVIKANIVHDNKYNYSISNYNGNRNKIKIFCLIHGIFEQISSDHLNGHGCPKCSHPSKRLDNDEFIKKAIKIHNDAYDYTLIKYISARKKICIICNKHGMFMQTPNAHLNGQGCPVCKKSKGETDIIKFLNENDVVFEYQKSFNDCKNVNKLFFDFYLPKQKILIEFDGEQHNHAFKHFGGELKLNKTIINDKIKTEYAKNNNIKLLRIPYTERNNLSEILKNNITI